jgi:hypothetical protein
MRATLVMLVLLLPGPAAAQSDEHAAGTDAVVAASVLVPTPPPPKEEELPTGNVGYIDDAIIRTQVRLRFESARDDTRPDRAEFFYGKCGCYTGLLKAGFPLRLAYDPNAPGPGPGIPQAINFQQVYAEAQVAIMKRLAVFVELPLRWLQAAPDDGSISSASGISDLRGGVKLALLSGRDHTVAFQFQGYFPTGSASNGLGTNHGSIEPALLVFQRVGDRMAIEGQVGDLHPTSGSQGEDLSSPGFVFPSSTAKFSGDVVFYGVGPSFDLVHTERLSFAPVVELVGWHVVRGFETMGPVVTNGFEVVRPAADSSGTNIVNLKIGARATFSNGSSIYVGYGRALTTATWYHDILRVEYRYSF